MSEFIQVTTTVAIQEDADILAKLALENRLAACVQVSSCRSTYHWEGNIEQNNELKLIMKSHRKLYPELEKLILENHPYDVPEIIALPVLECNSAYLDWLANELKASESGDE
jgi:periplasmic divalent cation tolerance protein